MSATSVKAAAIGVVAGILSGLLGIGGGVLVVPGLVLWLGLVQREASGTSMATIVASSGTALIGFAVSDNVDWVSALLIVVGGAVGAVVGARIASRAPERLLTAAFSVVLFVAGLRMMIG